MDKCYLTSLNLAYTFYKHLRRGGLPVARFRDQPQKLWRVTCACLLNYQILDILHLKILDLSVYLSFV